MLGGSRRFWLTQPTAVVVLNPARTSTSRGASPWLRGRVLDEAARTEVPIDRDLALSVPPWHTLSGSRGQLSGQRPHGARCFPLTGAAWCHSGRISVDAIADPCRRSSSRRPATGQPPNTSRPVPPLPPRSLHPVAGLRWIASCDQSHRPPCRRCGFHKRAAEFNQLVVDAIQANDLGRLVDVEHRLLWDAKPDAWWQYADVARRFDPATGGSAG